MADERFSSQRAEDAAQDGPQAERTGRGTRPGGNREGGGFRIRLSDNEMQAARALQEAFGLRSTVAVLGFSLRALAQQLEQGQLEDLIAQHRSQAGARPSGPRDGSRPGERGGERRRERGAVDAGRGGRGRVDPFARPARPAAATAEEVNSADDVVAVVDDDAVVVNDDAAIDTPAAESPDPAPEANEAPESAPSDA